MKKALILLDSEYQDSEVIYPYYRLIEADFETVLVAEKAGEVYKGKYGYSFVADLAVADVAVDEYAVVVIPGGNAPDKMRTKPALVQLVREAFEKGKIVAAVCHGPQLLIEADVVRGKKVTAYTAVKTDLINAGAEFEDSEVVVDGNLITSRKPADLPAFMKAIVERA